MSGALNKKFKAKSKWLTASNSAKISNCRIVICSKEHGTSRVPPIFGRDLRLNGGVDEKENLLHNYHVPG